jgi:hypothetical protein
MRWSVISHISCSMVSFGAQVVTCFVIRSDTDWSSTSDACAAMLRTTSRSERIPSMRRPSVDTTSAPTRRSFSRATASRTVASGLIVATSSPLPARMLCTYIRNLPGARCAG